MRWSSDPFVLNHLPGGSNTEYVVLVPHLAPLLATKLPLIAAETDDGPEFNRGWIRPTTPERWLAGEMLPHLANFSNADSVHRRLRTTLYGGAKLVQAEIADAMLLALQTTFATEGIPVLPSHKRHAPEMVDAWAWARGTAPRHRLALTDAVWATAVHLYHNPTLRPCAAPEVIEILGGTEWLTADPDMSPMDAPTPHRHCLRTVRPPSRRFGTTSHTFSPTPSVATI